jgi:hypothetical protein
MLVRLLDAFVWRSHGEYVPPIHPTHSAERLFRQARSTSIRFHICTRHECARRTLFVHNALRTRGLLLFCQVHRRCVSLVCSTHSGGCTPGSEGCLLLASITPSDCALKLLDRCLQQVDPELFAFLRSKNLSAEIWAFPCEKFIRKISLIEDVDTGIQLFLRSAHARHHWTKSCNFGIFY